MSTELSLDQAVELDIADEPNAVPATVPEDNLHAYEPEAPIHTDVALTLDEASTLPIVGDDETQPVPAPETAVTINGEAVPLADLVKAHVAMKQVRDRIGMLEDEYHALQASADGVVNAAWALSEVAMQNMPPEPDAYLAQVNPSVYTAQKAAYEQAVAGLQHILGQGQVASQAITAANERYHGMILATENAALERHFPETANRQNREQFFNKLLDVAHACGFSREEFEQVVDHRIFRLGQLALKGMEAVSPAPKHKEKRKQRQRRYSDAMDRLNQLGTVEAAMAVDFD